MLTAHAPVLAIGANRRAVHSMADGQTVRFLDTRSEVDEALERLHMEPPGLVIVGAEAVDPLMVARRVRAADADVGILVLPGAEDLERLQAEALVTPGLDYNVQIRLSEEADATTIRRLVREGAARRSYREMAGRAVSEVDAVGAWGPLERSGTLDRLLQHAPVGIVFLDRGHRIRLLNEQAEHMLGVGEAEEALGVTLVEFAAEPRREAWERLLTRVATDERTLHDEIRGPGGPPMEVTVAHVDDGWLVVLRDMSARVAAEEARTRAEAAVRETERLERVTAFTAGVAHDFNNLLAAIGGNVDLARDAVAHDPEARTCLDEALRAVDRAAELTRQLLMYSGQAPRRAQRVDLGALLREVVAEIERPSGAPPVGMEIPDSMPPALVDPGQIRRLFESLLRNAVEADPGTQAVTAELEYEVENGRTAYTVTVRDEGEGMDQDVVARAAEPFFTTKDLGRGLGLPVAQGVLRTHRGTLILTSDPGEGTCVKGVFYDLPG